ncbi:MAG: hypothetical protein QNJ51_09545 [Calothrix sp. MO_167.B12]|nr:hypothetical protein [Calothrix sp. MO_167.B12]
MTEEVNVILKTHHFLKSNGLEEHNVVRIYTDAHHTLLSHKALEPFQRFTLDMGDFVLHPDIVGQLDDGETIFAVEAKGDDDLLKGLAQAEIYQNGFHYSFLAANASAWGTSLIKFARRKNIGVITVSDVVRILFYPEAKMPLRHAFKFISLQMESVIQVTKGHTFYFNVPTHYLVWSIILESDVSYSFDNLPRLLRGYPMPKDWNQALTGAQKLGIVRILGKLVELTPIGSAVKVLLPTNIETWAEVHKQVKLRSTNGVALVNCQPQAAAALRILLLQNPITRLVIEGLHKFESHTANFADLAQVCDQIDHARAPIFFLEPKAAALLVDNKGKINWGQIKSEDYRSTMFQQYKSILIHAGILKNTKLGGTTAKNYDPQEDIWELI